MELIEREMVFDGFKENLCIDMTGVLDTLHRKLFYSFPDQFCRVAVGERARIIYRFCFTRLFDCEYQIDGDDPF